MIQKNNLFRASYASWCVLGFYRGVNDYNYSIKRSRNKKNILYIDSIRTGFLGSFIYGFPLIFPLLIYKEIYRLEVDIRNLEHEKETDFYNRLI